jgi:hypothetical protein
VYGVASKVQQIVNRVRQPFRHTFSVRFTNIIDKQLAFFIFQSRTIHPHIMQIFRDVTVSEKLSIVFTKNRIAAVQNCDFVANNAGEEINIPYIYEGE